MKRKSNTHIVNFLSKYDTRGEKIAVLGTLIEMTAKLGEAAVAENNTIKHDPDFEKRLRQIIRTEAL